MYELEEKSYLYFLVVIPILTLLFLIRSILEKKKTKTIRRYRINQKIKSREIYIQTYFENWCCSSRNDISDHSFGKSKNGNQNGESKASRN